MIRCPRCMAYHWPDHCPSWSKEFAMSGLRALATFAPLGWLAARDAQTERRVARLADELASLALLVARIHAKTSDHQLRIEELEARSEVR